MNRRTAHATTKTPARTGGEDRPAPACQGRHGDRLTYNRGCRCRPCTDAAARYERGRQWDIVRGQSRSVPILGPRRRMQALVALGYDYHDLGRYLGVSGELIRAWANSRTFMYRRTAERIATMYDALSMTLPPQHTTAQKGKVARARNLAKRKGWLPPLAWDDIDNDPAPMVGDNQRHNADVDRVVVERVMAGENLPTTRAEKDEIVRRWRAAGWSLNELERRTGWKCDRYGREETAA